MTAGGIVSGFIRKEKYNLPSQTRVRKEGTKRVRDSHVPSV